MSYEDFGQARLPRWLRGRWGDAFTSIVFGSFDALILAAKDAAKQAFVTTCADDAVAEHGADRLLEPLDGETTAAYRLRIQDAWTFWSELASTTKLRDAIRLYTGLDALFVYPMNADNTTDAWADGFVTGPDDDGETDNWSRHAIVIAAPHPWTRPVVGPDLVVGPGIMVGLTMTISELSRLRRAYRKHRPSHMVGITAVVLMDATAPDDFRVDHSVTTDLVRLPLHATMVGYPHHGTVGQLVVGNVFT